MFDPKAVPDSTVLNEARALEVFDSTGNKVLFGSLFENEKVVVVFIRL
jgi:hypothetical protein